MPSNKLHIVGGTRYSAEIRRSRNRQNGNAMEFPNALYSETEP